MFDFCQIPKNGKVLAKMGFQIGYPTSKISN